MIRKAIQLFAVVLIVGLLAMFWVRYSDFATTTRYCPWSHRLGFSPWVCKVKDVRDGRILVHHAQLDTGRLELSIEEKGLHHWIQHPEGHVALFFDALDQNSITFDGTDQNFLVVNGERFPITYIEKP